MKESLQIFSSQTMGAKTRSTQEVLVT